MSSLWCDHCGSEAITSDEDVFTEGDGEKCETCGWPGQVAVEEDANTWDDEPAAWWNTSSAADATCDDPKCTDCAKSEAS